jgi:hypothetical protein
MKTGAGSLARDALAAIALALAGCASTPQASPDRDTEAKRFLTHPRTAALYVYRDDLGDPDGADSVLYLDERLIGATLPGTYFRVDARPGSHVLRGIGHDQGSLRIGLRSGELHFVSLRVLGGQSYFEEVPAEKAKRDLLRCCVLLENWAPGQRPLLR